MDRRARKGPPRLKLAPLGCDWLRAPRFAPVQLEQDGATHSVRAWRTAMFRPTPTHHTRLL
eukprot:22235-Prymnesium_polylepis.1